MWYSVNLLMKGASPTRAPDDVLWEEDLLLIQADSAEDAVVGDRNHQVSGN